ncbi:MAG: ptsp [Ilumatobacteraceae bacterium]|nr:ptsp [Ilumatobacteraceae bacterium]
MTTPEGGSSAAPERALRDIAHTLAGYVPSVLATSSAAGVPNVTYVSKVLMVDEQRVALSNQFLSKTARNLAENPQVSLLVVDGESHDEYRLTLVYERTERRGPVFDQLATDVDLIASMVGMEDVFRLQAADIYRCTNIEVIRELGPIDPPGRLDSVAAGRGLGELCARISRCRDLDALVRVTVDGLAELLGHDHSMLLLADETGRTLFTIASRGYETEGIGSEVSVGDGVVGMAAAQCAAMRVGNLRQMVKYGSSVRRSFEEAGGIGPGREIPVPSLFEAESRLAVPAMALGQLVGVLTVEDGRKHRYTEVDESALQVVASLLASTIEAIRAEERAVEAASVRSPAAPPTTEGPTTHVRFFAVDGSTFLDGDYLIKGVAGRLLWSLLRQNQDEGRIEFTNREVRLDPSLDLPDFRDNFESRLILLKRRLDERGAPIRIAKTGRGRFRLDVGAALRLEAMGSPED